MTYDRCPFCGRGPLPQPAPAEERARVAHVGAWERAYGVDAARNCTHSTRSTGGWCPDCERDRLVAWNGRRALDAAEDHTRLQPAHVRLEAALARVRDLEHKLAAALAASDSE